MTLGRVVAFLAGGRGAILRLAESRWTLPVGLALVLSGGLARNYDGQDLLAEPWVLLAGVVVSTFNALVLFAMVYLVARARGSKVPSFFGGYRVFLGLFWMTAPMAWLYAIPYERFLSPVEAVRANLATLAFVSVWRVLLSARALSVLFGAPFVAVLTLVLLFSDVTLFVASLASPKPAIDVMGGLQHTDEDALIASAAFAVTVWSVLLAPVVAIAAFVGGFWVRGEWQASTPAGVERLPRGPVALACVALLAWLPALVFTQPEQRLRRRAEELLRGGRIEEAFAGMSRHERSAYPPIWDPPPRLGYFEREPGLAEVARVLEERPPAAWVRDVYLDKLARDLLRSLSRGASSFEEAAAMGAPRDGLTDDQRRSVALLVEHGWGPSEAERVAVRRMLEAAGASDAGMSEEDR